MKKKFMKQIVLSMVVLIFTLGASMVSFARDNAAYERAKNTKVDSELLNPLVRRSTSESQDSRSTALAAAMCEISNEGSGIIGVYAETTMHTPVDWACLTVYLERWNETEQDWEFCTDFYQEFLPEGSTPLILVKLQEYVDDEPTGYYYRVRAIHELEYNDGWYEAKVTKTSGIMITSEP